MTPNETATVLRQLTDWRRGVDVDPPKPGEVFEAIDAAIAMIERLEAGRLIDGLAVRPMKARKLIRICLMSATREMPKYECHKIVWALKIAGIVGDQHGGVYFQPAEEGYDKVPMSPEYVAKHKPEVGGYYVVYEDGYKSFSPAGAFESGYARIDG